MISSQDRINSPSGSVMSKLIKLEVFMIIELLPGVLAGKSGIAKYHEGFAEL